jgi:hypothetical protein
MASQNVVQPIDIHPPLAGAGGGRVESNMLDVLFSIILSLLVSFLSRIVNKVPCCAHGLSVRVEP